MNTHQKVATFYNLPENFTGTQAKVLNGLADKFHMEFPPILYENSILANELFLRIKKLRRNKRRSYKRRIEYHISNVLLESFGLQDAAE